MNNEYSHVQENVCIYYLVIYWHKGDIKFVRFYTLEKLMGKTKRTVLQWRKSSQNFLESFSGNIISWTDGIKTKVISLHRVIALQLNCSNRVLLFTCVSG